MNFHIVSLRSRGRMRTRSLGSKTVLLQRLHRSKWPNRTASLIPSQPRLHAGQKSARLSTYHVQFSWVRCLCGTTGIFVTQIPSPCRQVPSLAYFANGWQLDAKPLPKKPKPAPVPRTKILRAKPRNKSHTQNSCYSECNLLRNCGWAHGILV